MRDLVLVVMVWMMAAGFACALNALAAALSAGRMGFHWLDLLSVPALIVALWLGVHLFGTGAWLGFAAALAFHGYTAWLGPARARERVYTVILCRRSGFRLAAIIFLALVTIFSLA